MKNSKIFCTIFFFLILSSAIIPLSAQEAVGEKSQVTVSWEEFKKLLNLDENELVIPLDTFQKLLAQTGIKTVPSYTLRAGNVVLSRQEFQKLVDQMKPPIDPKQAPPFEYLITKSIYSGKIGTDNSLFTGTFLVHVLKKEGYLKVPLLPQSLALKDMKIAGKQALVVSEGGYHKAVISNPGEYEVTASFSLKSSLEKGPHKIDLTIQQTPITLMELEFPLDDISVEIPQAQQVVSRLRGKTTYVSAILSPGRSISVRWRKKALITEKVPAKVYGEVFHLISIEDDAFKINSDITLTILHSEVDGVQLSLPDTMNVLNVSGEGVGEWQEDEQENQRLVTIPFTYGKKGTVRISVSSETMLSDGGLGNIFAGFQLLDCVRETGFIGVALNTSAEVLVAENDGIETIAVQKLPRQLINKSNKPLLFGFKYLKHPYRLVLDVKKHEKIAVPMATINSANVVTLFTEDGKVIHRILYQVRNSAKQFLEIVVPEGGDVWSVFVGNKPVESSLNGAGKLLIPLNRSSSVNNQLDTFPVEIIFAMVEDRFSHVGSRGSTLPEVDLLISQLMWSVYLPNDYSYNYFSSSLEKEEIIRGINLFAGVKRRYNENVMRELSDADEVLNDQLGRDKMEKAYEGKESRSQFRNVPMQEEQITSQMEAEMTFGGRLDGLKQNTEPAVTSGVSGSSGVLPIQIQIPTSGQVYRFARTIIKSEDPLIFRVFYTRSWVNNFVRWFVLFIIILIGVLNRKWFGRFARWLAHQFESWITRYKRYESQIKKIIRSRLTPYVLFGFMFVVWQISRFLGILLLFVLWIIVIYQILLWLKTKNEKPFQPQSKPEAETENKNKNEDKLRD